MADLHDYKHARHLSSSLTTPKPTFMVEFAVVAMLYCMPQAKSGEIVDTVSYHYNATKLRWLCILFVYNECESPYGYGVGAVAFMVSTYQECWHFV